MKEVQAQAARLVPISGQRQERRPKPTPPQPCKLSYRCQRSEVVAKRDTPCQCWATAARQMKPEYKVIGHVERIVRHLAGFFTIVPGDWCDVPTTTEN